MKYALKGTLAMLMMIGLSYADTSDVLNTTSTVNAPNSVVISSFRTVVTVSSSDPTGPLFAGQPMACAKPSGPRATDCCSTSGWGTNNALNFCMTQERVLAEARNAGTAEYIGDTCMQENGVCKTPMSVYCVFPDNISYQIQTQGRKQIGLNFGTADTPNCSGLTGDQIKQIDITQINFAGQESQAQTAPASTAPITPAVQASSNS